MTLRCCCGRRHDPGLAVRQMIADYGRNIIVTGPTGSFWVPRIYIAVHGLRSLDLAPLAYRYGWARVQTRTA